jgi:glycosyltransferase involved in cell wall biosynthesis
MRILFISRPSLFRVRGGDTVQMEQTAAALRLRGVEVDIRLADAGDIDYTDYDLVHFFNLIRPADIIVHIQRSQLPFVLSPIYVDYSGVPEGNVLRRLLYRTAGPFGQEYVKCLARALRNGENVLSWQYLLWGQRRSMAYILAHCAQLLPNSVSEYQRLKTDFPQAGSYRVVPNGIDVSTFALPAGNELPGYRKDIVLCVARFEPRKNQLALIQALNSLPFELRLIGATAPNHIAYYEQCSAIAGQRVKFYSFMSPEELATVYAQCKVHILPSWHETTGLSSLEAAAMGCNVVVTRKGDAADYFGSNAWYCEPGDAQSIRAAVLAAMEAPVNPLLAQRVRETFNWERAAQVSLEAYKNVLSS